MNQKLLIVDDQDDLRRMLRIALGYGKYVMFEADNGADALDIAEREHPDVILLDVMMPGGLDGFEVCRRIRQLAKTSEYMPYVAQLTARQQTADIEAGRAAGANIYIIKPYSPMRLVEIIESRANASATMTVVRPGP
ncbi:MAG: response regulator [Rhodocyclaceae bacterium]|nr:MAG: response regulator [Rhodocyclaceae bacterium]